MVKNTKMDQEEPQQHENIRMVCLWTAHNLDFEQKLFLALSHLFNGEMVVMTDAH